MVDCWTDTLSTVKQTHRQLLAANSVFVSVRWVLYTIVCCLLRLDRILSCLQKVSSFICIMQREFCVFQISLQLSREGIVTSQGGRGTMFCGDHCGCLMYMWVARSRWRASIDKFYDDIVLQLQCSNVDNVILMDSLWKGSLHIWSFVSVIVSICMCVMCISLCLSFPCHGAKFTWNSDSIPFFIFISTTK